MMGSMSKGRAAFATWGVVVIMAAGLAGAQQGPAEKAQTPAGERVPRPQEPTGTLPYEEEAVSYRNPNATDVILAGTLTRPRADKPVPAVLLISGAGPQDRDETISGHKPFLVLADYLTRRGMAVLRVDDRGTGESTGDFATASIRDFASDAVCSFDFLRTRKDIDQAHIGLIGHGEGAIIAGILAAGIPKTAFVVLLGGTAEYGEEVLLEQTARAQMTAGLPEDQIQADADVGKLLYGMVRAGKSEAEMKQALSRLPEEYAPFLEHWQKQLPKLQTPWLRFFLAYDPKTALEKVTCPVLALWGEKDMQVDPAQNASAMKSALSHAHNHDVKIKVLPGLNYMFQKANTGLAWEYATISETISPSVLAMIGEWIEKQIS